MTNPSTEQTFSGAVFEAERRSSSPAARLGALTESASADPLPRTISHTRGSSSEPSCSPPTSTQQAIAASNTSRAVMKYLKQRVPQRAGALSVGRRHHQRLAQHARRIGRLRLQLPGRDVRDPGLDPEVRSRARERWCSAPTSARSAASRRTRSRPASPRSPPARRSTAAYFTSMTGGKTFSSRSRRRSPSSRRRTRSPPTPPKTMAAEHERGTHAVSSTRGRRLWPAFALISTLALCAVVGAGSASASSSQATAAITVFAGSSMTQVLPEIDPGNTYSFGSTGTLATQITNGAPADVLMGANTTTCASLYASGVAEKPVNFTRNTLAVVVPKSNPAGITSIYDLTKSGIKIDEAASSVPVGSYTVQVPEPDGPERAGAGERRQPGDLRRERRREGRARPGRRRLRLPLRLRDRPDAPDADHGAGVGAAEDHVLDVHHDQEPEPGRSAGLGRQDPEPAPGRRSSSRTASCR